MQHTELEITDEAIKAFVLETHLLGHDEFERLEAQARGLAQERQSKAATILYRIDLARQMLSICRYASGEILEEIQLSPEDHGSQQGLPQTQTWAQQLLCIDPADGRVASSGPVLAQPGLLVTSQNSYLYQNDFEHRQLVTASSVWLDPRSLKQRGTTGPYDLQVSPQHHFVFVTDRAAGTLIVLSADSHSVMARLQIRSPGSHKGIHLAIDDTNDKVYITDNETSNLKILSLKTFRLRNYQPGLGVLGNLMLDKDPRYLYLLTLKPNLGCKYIDTDSFETIKDIALRGKLLSKDGDAPVDSLFLTSDKQHALVVTYRDDTEPWAPLVTVLETGEVRPVLRYNLPEGTSPWLLASESLNPFYVTAPTLTQLLQQRGLLGPEQLSALIQGRIRAQVQEVDIEHKQFQPLLAELDQSESPRVPRIKLPKEAEEEIQEILRTAFYRQTRIQLRDHRIEMNKLEDLAFSTRVGLEQHDKVEIHKSNFFFNHFSLQLTIYRDSILSLLEYRKQQDKQPKNTPPYRCPRCAVSTMGRWLCPSCHFQMLQPEWLDRRALSSVETDTLAVPGTCLVPKDKQILLLSPEQECLWRYDLAEAGLEGASDVRMLPQQHLLVCDPHSARVVELSELGHVIWEVAGVPLGRPVKASWYLQYGIEHILIADPGMKQVLELNRANEVLWKYGGPGLELLREPVSIQRTYRQSYLIADRGLGKVLEVSAQGQLLKEHGHALALRKPVYARLTLDEQLLIVDAETHEIYLLDKDDQISFSFNYQPPELPDSMRLGALSWVSQGLGGEVLLSDGLTVLAADPCLRQIRWHCDLNKLPAVQEILADEKAMFFAPNPLEQRIAFLEAQPIYKGISADALLLLVKAMTPATFRLGEKIVIEGDKGTAMFTILQGTVQVFKAGNQDPIASLHSGDTFGEMALYLLEDRSATVIAKTDCYLLRLDHGPFRKAMHDFPELNSRFKELCLKRKRVLHQRKVGRYQDAVEDLKTRMALARMRKLNLFKTLSPSIFEALRERLYSVSYPRHHFVFRHKDPVRQLYFISRGSIEVLGENDRLMNTLSEGDVFGEVALMLDRPRTASVRTKGYCELYQLDKEALYQALHRYPELSEQLTRIAQERFERDAGVPAAADARPEDPGSLLEASTTGQASFGQRLIFCASLDARQVVGVDASGQIQWVFGGHEAQQVLNPCWVSETAHTLLLTDAGHNRVLEVDKQTRAVLNEYGDDELQLYQPSSAVYTGEGTILICDQGSESIFEVEQGAQGKVSWAFQDPEFVVSPRYAELTAAGTVLYADDELHQIVEVNRDGEPIWYYGEAMLPGDDLGQLNGPVFATRLENGNTLIADSANDRVLEVNPDQEIVWFFDGTPEQPLTRPQSAKRLENGNTLIGYDWQTQIAEVTPVLRVNWHCQLAQTKPVQTEPVEAG